MRSFNYLEIPKEKKVKLVAYKLKDGASAWWEQLQLSRMRQGKTPIRTWQRIKCKMHGRFLSLDYDQVLFRQYQNCKQGNQSVREYAEEFHRLSSWNDLAESKSQQVARFTEGLQAAIVICKTRPLTMCLTLINFFY